MAPLSDPSSVETFLQLAATELPIVIWQTDAELKFTASFGAGLLGLNLQSEEVVGMSLFDYFRTADPDFPPIKLHRDALQGATGCHEIQWGGRDFHYRVAPLRSDRGEIVGCLGVAHDITDAKQSRNVLRENEGKYRLLIDNQTDLVTKFDAQRRATYVSPSCCRVFGQSEQELLRTDFLSLVHEDDRQRVTDAIQRVYRPPHTSSVEVRNWTAKGWRWLAWVNTAVRNERGDVVEVVGVGRDVTERKEAEEALRASEARFRAIFDHAAIGIVLANLQGELLLWNSAFRHMLGYSDREMGRIRVHDFTFPEDLDAEIRAIHELCDGKRDAYRIEKRYRRKDGSPLWGDLSCTVVMDDHGEPRFVIGMVEDITHRKRVEEELRKARDELELRVKERTADLAAANKSLREQIAERRQAERALDASERRFRLAFEESPWGMTIMGPDGIWLQVNRAFSDMLGYEPQELVGMSAAQVTHPDDLQYNSELTRQLVEGAIPAFHFEKRYIRRDDGIVWAAINATLLRDHQGRILYGLTMVDDITQRKQTEQALRRAERLSAIGTLAAGIAHEVNNPLGAIRLDAETALFCSEQPDGQKTVQACLKNIAASAERGGQIVKDVLKFARRENQPRTTADLRGAVERACRLTRGLAEDRGVSIDYHRPEEAVAGQFSGTEIEQVLVNLITNAIQASEAGNRVEVVPRQESNAACVLVRDYGRGMSPDEVNRIFDPFFTTRATEGGTGLGLSISYGIVQEHNGTIDVESHPNIGTSIVVRLPVRRGEVSPASAGGQA